MKLRVWAEFLPMETALERSTIELLKEFGVNLLMAFGPGGEGKGFDRLLGDYAEAGVEVGLWLLLTDEEGYWGNERNADIYFRRIESIYDWADKAGLEVPWIGVDLELPIYMLQRLESRPLLARLPELIQLVRENRNPERFRQSVEKFQKVQDFINARGGRTVTASSNLLIEDLFTGAQALQDLHETPIFDINWDIISFMLYNSMFVGYSKGLISWKDARWYLYSLCRDIKEKLGPRAGVSLGVTYIGKLGDEPYYESPREMLPDIETVKAAGIEDITVFNLEGILRAPRPADWFEMILNARARVPERSIKVELARKALQAASRLL